MLREFTPVLSPQDAKGLPTISDTNTSFYWNSWILSGGYREKHKLAEQFYTQAHPCCGSAPKWVFPSAYFAQKQENPSSKTKMRKAWENNPFWTETFTRLRLWTLYMKGEKWIAFQICHFPSIFNRGWVPVNHSQRGTLPNIM